MPLTTVRRSWNVRVRSSPAICRVSCSNRTESPVLHPKRKRSEWFFGRTRVALKLGFVDTPRVVAAGVGEGARQLAAGHFVVVVDDAAALVALRAGRGADAPGRLAVVVGDPADPAALDAARQLSEQLFGTES
jgi:hypothetical protein